jgi:hypothetical protein
MRRIAATSCGVLGLPLLAAAAGAPSGHASLQGKDWAFLEKY